MKTVLKLSVLLLVLACIFTSCDSDDGLGKRYWVGWGDVKVVDNSYDVLLDDGITLHIVETSVPLYEIINGDRVIINYIMLETGTGDYDIRLNALKSLTTKASVYKSGLSEPELGAMGVDYITMLQSPWLGADKYLNIAFVYKYSYSNITHSVNLLIDDENSTSEEIIAEIRHNANGDYPNSEAEGYMSFKVNDLIPAGQDEVKLTVTWKDYNERTHSTTVTLKRTPENNEIKS